MARPLRVECEGSFYHVTSRRNDRKKIFYCGKDYIKFKAYIEEGINNLIIVKMFEK